MEFINTVSLITAFAGGMVALFAPCCITYLLPSYLANIFRSRKSIVGMTIIFGLGIATILVPTALGIRAVGELFQNYHTQTYIIGGVFMILLGLMELTGRKITIPMIHLTIDLNTHHNPWSVYLMGVFSGITSSCCTPVLAGILTLSFLSPTFLWAALAGISYVFGMVVPLVIMALILEKINWTKVPQWKNKSIEIAGKHVLLTSALAGVIFILVGITFATLAITGNITMGSQQPVEQTIGVGLMNIVRFLRTVPGSEMVFGIFLVMMIVIGIYKVKK